MNIFKKSLVSGCLKANKKNGFSMIELVVIIAILAILIMVLLPSLLTYTERSRASKDISSMDEITNTIMLTLQTQDGYDEMLKYSRLDNVSCYVDSASESNYEIVITKQAAVGSVSQYMFNADSRLADEIPYYAAGNMRGVTITFEPQPGAKNLTYDLKDAVVNKFVQSGGSVRLGECTCIYNALRQTVGDTIKLDSQTYRNSDYTVFIRMGTTGGNQASAQDSIVVYGQYNGTNLSEPVSTVLTTDRVTGDTGANLPESDGNQEVGGNTPSYDDSDLIGGGTMSPGNQGNGNLNDGQDENNDEEPLPPGMAQALFLQDSSLVFVRSETAYQVGEMYDGKKITHIFTDFETGQYDDSWDVPWRSRIVKKVVVKDEIRPESTAYWFANQDRCESLDLTNLNTSHVTDMRSMFYLTGADSSIRSVTLVGLDNWDTSKVTNMNSMFRGLGDREGYYGYTSVKTVTIGDLSNWNVSNVTDMAYMFSYAGARTQNWSIGDLSDWNVSKVTDMSCMFRYAGNDKATTFNLGNLCNWDTSSVTNMHEMFYGAAQRATTWNIGDISNWNTSKVTDMNWMFRNAGYADYNWNIGDLGTKQVTANGKTYIAWDVSNVTNMKGMFTSAGYYKKDKWTVGDLSKWNTSKVTSMNAMFHNAGYYYATSWDVGDISDWNTSSVTDMSYMFGYAGSRSRAQIYLGDLTKWDVANVTGYGNFSVSTNGNIISPKFGQ